MLTFLQGLWARAAWYLLAAVLAAGFAAGTVWYFVSKRLAAKDAQIATLAAGLEQAAKQRTLDRATMSRLARKNAATARAAASAQASLAAAVQAQPAWAAEPVPQEVQDALK